MKSMTGHGRGEAARNGSKVTVEVSSVNRKQGEIHLNLPRELEAVESRVRDAINQRVARGRLAVKVQLQTSPELWGSQVRVNLPLARAYASEFGRLAKTLKLTGGVTLESLLRMPGVVGAEEPEADAEVLWPLVESALGRALAGLIETRSKEGANLARDLALRVVRMRRLVGQVRQRAPKVVRAYQANLLARIRAAGLEGVRSDDERVVREVVLFADRSDFSEELTRLESHFGQFDDALRSREAVGRLLDFLAQEMSREINTIGSKANDAAISKAVVAFKAELEKFREQVQNVE